MRLLSIMIFCILTHFQLNAQSDNISMSELDTMYLQAIQMQYLFIVNGTFYIESNQNTERIKHVEELSYLKFLNTEDLIDESINKKKSLTVIRLNHRIISNDTIDINMGYLTLTAKRRIHFNHGLRFKKAEFKLASDGTEGYKPTCRFIFNAEIFKWEKTEKYSINYGR